MSESLDGDNSRTSPFRLNAAYSIRTMAHQLMLIRKYQPAADAYTVCLSLGIVMNQ
jgi:hypothetical protein